MYLCIRVYIYPFLSRSTILWLECDIFFYCFPSHMWRFFLSILPYFIDVAVPSQESERSCICALELAILSFPTTVIFEFAIVPTVSYILLIILWMKETNVGYNYNYEHNQYFTCSISCIYICLYNLYICQIIFPSFTDICVTRIDIVLIKKKTQKKTKPITLP